MTISVARSPSVHSPQAGERSRARSAQTLVHVGQKPRGTAATTSMCAQNVSCNGSHRTIAARLAPMHTVSVDDGRDQRERRHMASVTTIQAMAETMKTMPCASPGLTAT